MDFTEAGVETEKYGEKLKYDPAGPLQKTRARTDFCWLVAFIFCMLVWTIIMIYAFSEGDVGKWSAPMDSHGRVCGEDWSVFRQPYLVYYNRESCPESECLVCRAQCPEIDFTYERKENVTSIEIGSKYTSQDEQKKLATIVTGNNDKINNSNNNSSSNNSSVVKTGLMDAALADDEKLTFGSNNKITLIGRTKLLTGDNEGITLDKQTLELDDNAKILENTKKFMICRTEVRIQEVKSWKQLDHLIESGKCARTYKQTVKTNGYFCDIEDENHFNELDWRYVLPKLSRELSASKWSIMGFILLSALLALLSIIAMRWFALSFVCGSIFVLCAVAFYFIYEKCVNSIESKTGGVLLALFICIVVLGLIVLVAIYFRRQIYLACQMIKESSKAITCILSSLTLPFLLFFLYLLILGLGLSVYLLLTSLESPVYRADFDEHESCNCSLELGYLQNATCDPDVFATDCRTQDGNRCVLSGCYQIASKARSVGFLHFVNFVGLFWSYGFVVGFGDMVMAGVFATWYWTFNKKILTYLTVIESFWRVTTYHLGTVALGSLIILICTIIRCILSATYKCLNKVNRPFTALILMNLKCVFDLLDSFLNLVNRRAYIMCAVHGSDFIQSARTAFYLLMRSIGRVIAVYEITNCLLFVLTILISSITTRIAISYYSSDNSDVTFLSPPVVIFVGSFVVTGLLLRVVEIAVDTIFQCFLEDSERNDGSYEKPYFMSDELTKFLYKK